ncbi:hypothetical protein NL108_006453, partial [Boleophthalmus pectinirostris]
MEEVSDTAVLVTSSAPQSQTLQGSSDHNHASFQQKQAADSLIQVIQKLSKIVEKRPQRCRTLAGQKRLLYEASTRVPGVSAYRKTRKTCKEEESFVSTDGADEDACMLTSGDSNNNIATSVTEIADNPGSSEHKRTVTCYQCSLCPYLSPTLSLLREHLKQHDENHSDLILMCSECRFTSRDQDQLEAHVKLHFDNSPKDRIKSESSNELVQKKWYSYEEYGLYRCLICSYVCSQQRMLKTHAWKHAGLVDCTYPIFEDEEGAAGASRREPQIAQVSACVTTTREEVVLLSPVVQDKSTQNVQSGLKLQLCVPLAVENKQDVSTQSEPRVVKLEQEISEETVYPMKDVVADGPVVEVQVTTDAESHDNASDSLLSSAQKIINSSPNSAGHINVIVERLPSAGDAVLTTNPLLLSPDEDADKSILNASKHIKVEDEESDSTSSVDGQSIAENTVSTTDLPRDENVPPTGRKRTHSESLRLHSLAAEALVAMPMRTPELSNSKVVQKLEEQASDIKPSVVKPKREQSLGSLGEGDEEVTATKAAGISLSLLTVIERLRERSDQNTSDEDILKELQDNAQVQNGVTGGVVTGSGTASYVDGLVASSDNSLVDYIQGSDRPYRCKLCQYSSGNKGYIKQHLRVHKQRQPYQCPICEHIATDSKDLESHMINHCKTKMYQCKQCPESFHYKVSQMQTIALQSFLLKRNTASRTSKEILAEVDKIFFFFLIEHNGQKMYKCDECNYTSSTYLGVRNHRRIHNADKPYRCCSCDFATTNMNSLKSHMRRHPQEHQAVQLLEQYRCSLCGYVCSHPPSLKSHMWKHAGDQNYNYEQVNRAINEAISQSSR